MAISSSRYKSDKFRVRNSGGFQMSLGVLGGVGVDLREQGLPCRSAKRMINITRFGKVSAKGVVAHDCGVTPFCADNFPCYTFSQLVGCARENFTSNLHVQQRCRATPPENFMQCFTLLGRSADVKQDDRTVIWV